MHGTKLLKQDHDRVKQLFEQIETAEQFQECKRIFEEIRSELTVHAEIEERVFYPLFENREGFEDLIQDALEEHQEAKTLLEEISKISDENQFDNRVDELIDAVSHHIEDEEGELFPKVEKALSSEELEILGEKLQEAKQKTSEAA